ncbi:MAG: amidohydrolase family protein [Paracoccaceae bacterium]
MTTVIKNGTIVTADLTYKADVLIEDGRIAQIGENLKGDKELDATGCYVMPGGIDPHTHLEMPFMGTYSSDDFESGTRAALAGGTTMVVDFVLPGAGAGADRRQEDVAQQVDPRQLRLFLPHGCDLVGSRFQRHEDGDRDRRHHHIFKHFMAYKGALMVNDDEMYASFKRLAELGGIALVHAENGDVVAELSAKLLADGNVGPEAHAYSRPPQVEARPRTAPS